MHEKPFHVDLEIERLKSQGNPRVLIDGKVAPIGYEEDGQ